MSNIDNTIHPAKSHDQIIKDLKIESLYYPDVIIRRYKPEFNMSGVLYISYASALMRVFREDKWYVVHVVKSMCRTINNSEREMLLLFMQDAHQIQNLYVLNGKFDELDLCQQSEYQRLTDAYLNKFNR